MIGLVIVTHGDLAATLLTAMRHVTGEVPRVATVSIGPADDMAAKRDEIRNAIARTDEGTGVVVMTDLFGGTPSNLAISQMSDRVEILAGVNLPMLIRFAGERHNPSLAEVAVAAKDAGQRYISRAAEVLGQVPSLPIERRPVRDQQSARALATLDQLTGELGRLGELLRAQPREAALHGQIGHNLPPPAFTPDDAATLADGSAAATVAAREARKDEPDREVLRLCIAALKRVLSLLKQIARWALQKGDTFAEAAAKSAGKAVGPLMVAGGIAAGLSGRLAELLDYLRALAGI